MKRIVLAHSGRVESRAAIGWLMERHGAEVITVTVDVGQGRQLEQIRDQALAAGAVRAHVIDGVEVFAAQHVLPVLQAGAALDGGPSVVGYLARPLLAAHVVDIAQMESAAAVAHVGSCDGEDGTAFDRLLRSLRPTLPVIAPAREWRNEALDAAAFARGRGLAVEKPGGWQIESNLWGRSFRAEPGVEGAPPYALTREPHEAPAEPASVEIEFVRGVPGTLSGVSMPLPELLEALATIAGAHGVGRLGGISVAGSREAAESPAGVVLHAAHTALQSVTLPADLRHPSRLLAITYADLLREGRWFSPLRPALDAFRAAAQVHVTGSVRLRLSRGVCDVLDVEAAAHPSLAVNTEPSVKH